MSEIDYMNDPYAPQGFEPPALATLAQYLLNGCEVIEIQVQLRMQALPNASTEAAPFVAYVVFADVEAREENQSAEEESPGSQPMQEVFGHYYVFDAGYTKVVQMFDEFKTLIEDDPPTAAEMLAGRSA